MIHKVEMGLLLRCKDETEEEIMKNAEEHAMKDMNTSRRFNGS